VIESVGADEAEALARVHAQCFERPWSGGDITKMFDNPAVACSAARAGDIVGFVLFWIAAGDGEILTVAVRPDRRGEGLGRRLVEAAIVAAIARGAASLHLDVAEDNRAARGLYAKLGFLEAGRRKGYYSAARGAVDAIVMRLALPAC